MQIGTAIRIRVSWSRFIEPIINTANIYQPAQKIFDAREVSSSFPSSSSSTIRYTSTVFSVFRKEDHLARGRNMTFN